MNDLKVRIYSVNIEAFLKGNSATHFLLNFSPALFNDNFYKYIFYEACYVLWNKMISQRKEQWI